MNNGGADLSAGQRQLIALARAQLANAHILLLDEATSCLDRTSEERLMSSLTDVVHAGKHSALIVAHRLTTAQRCDLIAVIDKGYLRNTEPTNSCYLQAASIPAYGMTASAVLRSIASTT